MDYNQIEQFLFNQLPNYQVQGDKAFNKSLDKTLQLSEFVYHPWQGMKIIHVAGTNGKGSTSSLLSSILMENNMKAGLFTSPHLMSFRERIKVNGISISELDVVEFIQIIWPFIESYKPSFFEISTVMALWYFKKSNVDIAILETGLGGRLDSTNIITPIISVITSISMDHDNFLGQDVVSIAREKGGIIKENIPVVLGHLPNEAYHVLSDIGASKHSEVCSSTDIEIKDQGISGGMRIFDYNHCEYICPLIGDYQIHNFRTVLRTIKILQKSFNISNQAIENGLRKVSSNTGIIGRFQIVSENPKVILDVAHNQEGVEAVLKQIERTGYHRLHVIFGMVKGKDYHNILTLFPSNCKLYFVEPSNERALENALLSKAATALGLKNEVFENLEKAFKAISKIKNPDDIVYVGGSNFIISDYLMAYHIPGTP